MKNLSTSNAFQARLRNNAIFWDQIEIRSHSYLLSNF